MSEEITYWWTLRSTNLVAKVTGRAKYAAEFQVPNIAYGFIVLGSVAKGSIKSIDTKEAESSPGVVRVFTHLNTPKFGPKASTEEATPRGTQEEQDRSFPALQSDRIYFNMQPVALVVAETYEQSKTRTRPSSSPMTTGAWSVTRTPPSRGTTTWRCAGRLASCMTSSSTRSIAAEA